MMEPADDTPANPAVASRAAPPQTVIWRPLMCDAPNGCDHVAARRAGVHLV
jgi:hypothetical protein